MGVLIEFGSHARVHKELWKDCQERMPRDGSGRGEWRVLSQKESF